MFWSIYSSNWVKFLTQLPQLFIIKIYFTIKVNSICGAGRDTWNLCHKLNSQDPVSQGHNSQVPGTHFQGPGCQGPMSQSPSFRGLGVRVPCPTVPRSQASGSRVSESQGPGSQGPGLQVPESHGTGTQTPGVAGLRSQGPRSRVLGPDFRLCSFVFHINLINMEHKREHTSIKCKTFGKLLPSNQDHV